MTLHANLQQLGSQKTDYRYDQPDASLLERFPNPFAQGALNPHGVTGTLNITCPEFTSLCPVTGQPDFATIHIAYIPEVKMVESKSLKLYLFSFRNHGDFHEDCVNIIMKDLLALMQPKYIEVYGEFTPRGGIAIHPYANYGRPGSRFADMAAERLLNFQLR